MDYHNVCDKHESQIEKRKISWHELTACTINSPATLENEWLPPNGGI